MNELKYSITNDNISVVISGRVFIVSRHLPNFDKIKNALLASEWHLVPNLLSVDLLLRKWSADGRLSLVDGIIQLDGERLPEDLNARILALAETGGDPTSLFNFWKRLQANPSHRSVEQLWRFLNQLGIPLTSDGYFLAYKGVTQDFKDCHTGKIDNSPGQTVRVNRNKVSDDPNAPCHFGLHVGSLEYASNFGPNVVICKVDPANVVCVPYDHSSQKMRVCEYTVVGLHNDAGYMPSTVIDDTDLPSLDEPAVCCADDIVPSPDANQPSVSVTSDNTDGEDIGSIEYIFQQYENHPNMLESSLFSFRLDELRHFASQKLKIVGASRILGGKNALIKVILKKYKSLKSKSKSKK